MVKFLIDEVAADPDGFIIERILSVMYNEQCDIKGISVSLLKKKSATSGDVILTEFIYDKLLDAKKVLEAYKKKATLAAEKLAKRKEQAALKEKEDKNNKEKEEKLDNKKKKGKEGTKEEARNVGASTKDKTATDEVKDNKEKGNREKDKESDPTSSRVNKNLHGSVHEDSRGKGGGNEGVQTTTASRKEIDSDASTKSKVIINADIPGDDEDSEEGSSTEYGSSSEEDNRIEEVDSEPEDDFILDEDEEKRRMVDPCALVVYNPPKYESKALERYLGCEVISVDYNGGSSGIFVMVKGVANGQEASDRINDIGGPTEVYMKQSVDPFDKLRNVSVLGGVPNMPNGDAVKEGLMRAAVRYGEVEEVNYYKKSGFFCIIFKEVKTARRFENAPEPIRVVIFNATYTLVRNPIPILRDPCDVVVDGFFPEDETQVKAMIKERGNFIKSIRFVTRTPTYCAIVSFKSFKDAEAFANSKVPMTFTRPFSSIVTTCEIVWARDFNSRRGRKDNSNNNAESIKAVMGVEEGFINLRESYKSDRKEFLKELERIEKARDRDRVENRVFVVNMVADMQDRMTDNMDMMVDKLMDYNSTVNCNNIKLIGLQSERSSLSQRIDKCETATDSGAEARKTRLTEEKVNVEVRIREIEDSLLNLSKSKPKMERLTSPREKLIEMSTTPVILGVDSEKDTVLGEALDARKKRPRTRRINTPVDRKLMEKYKEIKMKSTEEYTKIASNIWADEWKAKLDEVAYKDADSKWLVRNKITDEEVDVFLPLLFTYATAFKGTVEAEEAHNIVVDVRGARQPCKRKRGADRKKKLIKN